MVYLLISDIKENYVQCNVSQVGEYRRPGEFCTVHKTQNLFTIYGSKHKVIIKSWNAALFKRSFCTYDVA